MNIEYVDLAGCSFTRVPETQPLRSTSGPAGSTISLPPFSIQKAATSVSQWLEFLEDTGYRWLWRQDLARFSPSPEHPAVFVSWFDCEVFCEWLSARLKQVVRLPWEVEWEHVCQVVMSSPGRTSIDPATDFDKWVGEHGELNARVDSGVSPNRACPCAGIWCGVSEWCLDWYHEDADQDLPPRVVMPRPPSAWKVWRGGSPLNDGYPRCTYRGYEDPNFRGPRLGFRTVKELRAG